MVLSGKNKLTVFILSILLLTLSQSFLVSGQWVRPPSLLDIGGNESPWTNTSTEIVIKPGFPDDVNVGASGSFIGGAVNPSANNTGNVGTSILFWASGFFSTLNVQTITTQVLDLLGDFTIDGTLTASGYPNCILQTDASGVTFCGNTSALTDNDTIIFGDILNLQNDVQSLNVSSGWVVGNGILHNNTPSVSVGIRTDSPTSALHVVGDANITGNVTTPRVDVGIVNVSQSILPFANNTVNIGEVDNRFARIFTEKINTSELGGYSPILLTSDLIGVEGVTVSAAFLSGDGSNITGIQFNQSQGLSILPNVTVLGSMLIDNNLTVLGNSSLTTPRVILVGSNDCILFTDGDGDIICNNQIAWSFNDSILFDNVSDLLGLINAVNASVGLTDNFTVTQNLSVGDTTLFVDNSRQSVAINGTNPTSTLHVFGNANVTGNISVGTGTLILTKDGILFTDGTFQNTSAVPPVAAGWNGTLDSIVFLINSSALVGIGTVSPSQKVEVVGNVLANSFLARANDWSNVTILPEQVLGLNLTEINLTVADFNQTILEVASVYNDTLLIQAVNTTENIEGLNFTTGPHTVDTNETSRFNNLISFDCPVGFFEIGVMENGTVTCRIHEEDGDWISDGLTLYNDTPNVRVGIGKSNPATNLDVVNTTRLSWDENNRTFRHQSIHDLQGIVGFTTIVTISPSVATDLETAGFVHTKVYGDSSGNAVGALDTLWWFTYSGGGLDKTEEVFKNSVGTAPHFQLLASGDDILLQVEASSGTFDGTVQFDIWTGGGGGANGQTILYTIN